MSAQHEMMSAMASNLPTTNFLDIDFVNESYRQIAAELDRLSQAKSFSFVTTPNVDHVVMMNGALEDGIQQQFRRAQAAATIRTCDSRVLQTLALFRGVRLQVVTGSDLTAMLFEEGYFDGRKVGLIGGDEAMLGELNARYPAVHVMQHIPPMGVLSNEPAIAAIEEFIKLNTFNYILFAIGAPRSEIIAHRCANLDGTVGVALCIGASVEFLIGRKARAPRFIQFLRMEWAFRLLSEPRRLWRRYLVTGPRVILIAMNWHKP
ncbi:WecB/TagA/CpsF family glycosyltransferase [Erythrobacter sp. CCH5-A1]|uniref:WecB/TagA/CpsF family glycosyltransferase n=1 Tax=Erythrobacter sp. CCH5-A1 TaxID=1768792 RepID=UPI0012E38F04|nr:WecB/TagA/CpsF family glycosyltransferase [Erythrobacter sp. CCH5-A1]